MCKICSKCKKSKKLSDFGNCKSSKDGLMYWCKSCISEYNINRNKDDAFKKRKKDYYKYNPSPHKRQSKEYHRGKSKEYRRTKKGICSTLFFAHKKSFENGRVVTLGYKKDELEKWILNQDIFHSLYDIWVKSGYNKYLKPSIDRKDDYRGYCINNIQIMTWDQNLRKHHNDRKNGTNNKVNTSVIQMDLKGNDIQVFHSLMEAQRVTKTNYNSISACCRNEQESSNGFKWKFNEKEIK